MYQYQPLPPRPLSPDGDPGDCGVVALLRAAASASCIFLVNKMNVFTSLNLTDKKKLAILYEQSYVQYVAR